MSEAEKPARRVRYGGTHPRKFGEKYKEQNPGRYAGEVAKVLASGKTPAGMHRPIMLREVLEILAPQPGEIVVDATLGYGGHARELLAAVQPGGRLIGLDVDSLELPKTEARLRALGFPEETLSVQCTNFAGLAGVLSTRAPGGAHAILADLGVSSMQLDDPARGFTFKHHGPLDLRMNPERGQPASALLAAVSEKDLARTLTEFSDEPLAGPLAYALVQACAQAPIITTTQLATIVRTALPAEAPEPESVVRRVFQALRIAVNDELATLDALLRHLPACLAPGGRVAILTFHSGEDRRVKHAFKDGLTEGRFSEISREILRPSPEELRANPRASSAKLRWAKRAA